MRSATWKSGRKGLVGAKIWFIIFKWKAFSYIFINYTLHLQYIVPLILKYFTNITANNFHAFLGLFYPSYKGPNFERQCDLVDRALDWESGDLSSMPASATDLICDLGQVTLSCLLRLSTLQGRGCLLLCVCTVASTMCPHSQLEPLGPTVTQINNNVTAGPVA